MKRNVLSVVALSISMIRCAVIPDLKKECEDKITKANYKKLEGRYFNKPAKAEVESYDYNRGKGHHPLLLWDQLIGRQYGYSEENRSIVLKFKSKAEAVAELYQGDSLITSTIIYGRIRKGYFYRRPYFFGIPFIPLVFGYRTYRYRLAMCDGNLVVDNRWNYYVFAIAAGTKGQGYSHEVFERER